MKGRAIVTAGIAWCGLTIFGSSPSVSADDLFRVPQSLLPSHGSQHAPVSHKTANRRMQRRNSTSGLTTAQGLVLAWNASTSTDIDGYRVYYGAASGNYDQHVDVGMSTTATVSSPPAGDTFYYVVVAYKGALESVPSNEVATSNVAAPSPTPTPAATPTSTPVPTETPTPTPTPLPIVTPVPSATPTPIPTATPVATATPIPVVTPVPAPTPSPTPVQNTVGGVPVASPTPTATVTASPTPTTIDQTAAPSPTATPVAEHGHNGHRRKLLRIQRLSSDIYRQPGTNGLLPQLQADAPTSSAGDLPNAVATGSGNSLAPSAVPAPQPSVQPNVTPPQPVSRRPTHP